jgi:hypothetical protein
MGFVAFPPPSITYPSCILQLQLHSGLPSICHSSPGIMIKVNSNVLVIAEPAYNNTFNLFSPQSKQTQNVQAPQVGHRAFK